MVRSLVGDTLLVHGSILAEHLGDLSAFNHPAATLVSVAGLARPDFLIEIEAIAVVE